MFLPESVVPDADEAGTRYTCANRRNRIGQVGLVLENATKAVSLWKHRSCSALQTGRPAFRARSVKARRPGRWTRLVRIGMLAVGLSLVTLLTGCSLLDIRLESGSSPLNPQERELRVETRALMHSAPVRRHSTGSGRGPTRSAPNCRR